MFSNRVRSTFATILLLFFGVAISWAQKPGSPDAESAAIKESVAAYTDVFNRHDARACAMRYVEDGDFTGMQGNTNHGRNEIEEHYATIFATFLKTAHRADTVKSIRFLAPEIASVDVDWSATGVKAPDGSEIPPVKGLLNLVMTKHNGEWLITVYHESEFASPPTK